MTNRTDQQFDDTQPPNFKADMIEEGRKLLEAREQSRVMRQKLLNDQEHQIILQPEIKNTSIGK